jgi:hypothetical protein
MTISKIEWIFFQPHKFTVIKPARGLTVITGTSRHGKSSLARGFKWLAENKPRGEDFKNWDAEDSDSVAVGAVFEEGESVSRERTPSYNQYHVSTLDKPLRALISDVPEEVSDITRMSSVNIQSQHDPYFMLQPPYSPGEIGRMLNEAVGLEIIDIYRDILASAIRKAGADIKYTDETIKKYESETEKYKDLDEIGALINTIEQILPEAKEMREWIETVSSILGDITIVTDELEELDKLLSAKEDLKEITQLIEVIETQNVEVQKIQATMGMIIVVEKELKDLTLWLEIKEIHTEMLQIVENVSKLRSERFTLERILRDINQTIDSVESGNQALTSLYADRDELFERLSICPFCNQPITADVLKHIKEMESI